jgi:hypothetical protein
MVKWAESCGGLEGSCSSLVELPAPVSSAIGSSVEEDGQGKAEFSSATPECESVSSGSMGITQVAGK